jgi:hypothetical protein
MSHRINQQLVKVKVKPVHKLGFIWAVFIGIGLCACKTSDYFANAHQTPSGQAWPIATLSEVALPSLVLDCPAPRQEMALDEIHVFTMTLSFAPPIQPDFDVMLETLGGADWNAALCVGEQCYMHDGVNPLRKSVTFDSPSELEIKIFVPAEAEAGAFKTVRLTLIENSHHTQTSIDITGYLPFL